MKTRLSFIAALGMYCFASSPIAHAQQVKADTGAVAIGRQLSVAPQSILAFPPNNWPQLVRQAGDLSETQKKLIAKLEGDLGPQPTSNPRRAEYSWRGERSARAPGRQARRVCRALQSPSGNGIGSAGRRSQNRSPESRRAEGHRCGRIGQSGCVARGCRDRAEARSRPPRCQRGRYLRPARRNRAYSIAIQRRRHALRQCGRRACPRGALTRTSGSATSKERQRALYQQGDEFGDNGALLSAIERYKRLVALMPRERVPLDWAATQNNLGNALKPLGSARAARRGSKRPSRPIARR